MTEPCETCGRPNPASAEFCGGCGARIFHPAEDAAIGTVVLGRYRLVRVIGEGAMGRVYEAEQQMGGATRRVAVKALHATLGKSRELMERFRRECELVIQLEHPNTIRFLDFGDLPDGRAAIVMEYVDGETLADRLERGPLSVEQVDRIVHQVCGSLHEAHQRGIVHRDLKPENVMLTERAGEQDVVKVCDFGIAKIDTEGESRLTQQGAVLGTPKYMSPEQFHGSNLDARSDVYSLGVMVYEMLTGELPFEAGNVFQWAERHLQAEPTPMEAHPAGAMVPEARRRAVMRALAKDPNARPATVLDFARELTGMAETPSAWGGIRSSGAVAAGMAATAQMPASVPGLSSVPGVATSMGHADPPAPFAGASSPSQVGEAPAGLVGCGTIWVAVAMFAVGAVGVGGVAAYFLLRDRVEQATTVVVPPAAADAAVSTPPVEVLVPDAGPAEEPHPPSPEPAPVIEPPPAGWLRIVHFQEGVDEPANALGAADGRFAVIRPGGRITLELAAGELVRSDRGPGPDLFIAVDDARSGPYRLEVGTGHHDLRIVAHDLIGSLPMDMDQYRVRQARYVRISARGRPVYLDGVGYYRRREASPHHH